MRLLAVLAVVLSVFVAACPASPVATPEAATPVPGAPSRASVACTEAAVRRVIDGDTVEIALGGETARVRYIGVDTPESVDPRRPVAPLAEEAAAQNRRLVEGRSVCLEKDVSETDQYGRLLRYVWVGDTIVNAELVRLGYAQAIAYPPDVKYQDHFRRLEREAREAGRGLWGLARTPTPGRTGG